MKIQEQKNKIKALETSATKLEQELRSREAAFDRVQGSVNKQLEDMLLKEYPEEYVQNNARNWLKIQQDIAFVKKSLKGSGPLRREIVKSLLERKKSAENDKHLGYKSLPERGAAAANSRKWPIFCCRLSLQRNETLCMVFYVACARLTVNNFTVIVRS